MRILLTSDWHLDAATAGFVRFDDLRATVRRIVDVAIAERVALFVFMGDLSNPDSVRVHASIEVAVEAAMNLARSGIPSRWLTGNHDVVEDGSGASTLSPLRPLSGVESTNPYPMVRVYDGPCFESIGGVGVLALPFTSRARAYDPAEVVSQFEANLPILVVGHLNIEGIEPGSETTDFPRGREVFLPIRVIRERMPKALVANGHYHRRTQYNGIHIPGAIASLTFGEQLNVPGVLIAEVAS
jgi:DNA repair exonuclease SbcCD nuclease subunit